MNRIPTYVYTSKEQACLKVADLIEQLILERRKPVVLGLPTGRTPLPLFRELIRRHKEEGLSFAQVITFNLDEYYGLEGNHPCSYRRFMNEQLFDHIDIDPRNTHIPDGMVDGSEINDFCRTYEAQIQKAGGIDLQILGVGRNGHAGFNEPGSPSDSRTRLVELTEMTRADTAESFGGEVNVPRQAITMGIGTILEARQVALMAWGAEKADIMVETLESQPSAERPASLLQMHSNCACYLDRAASRALIH